MDIRFYDFDFNLLYILPSFAVDTGYISVNAQQDFNSSGSLEILFSDNELKKIIEQHKDNILVVWKGFQGFLTSYRWDKDSRLTGMHLNGLLHRAVIPKTITELTGDVETLARSAVSSNIAWLCLGEVKGFSNEVKYSTEKYTLADEYIQNLLKLDNGGYRIKADIPNKKYIFECIKPEKNPLMLSEGNLNAYDFEITYINKEKAFGGWYEKEQPEDSEGNRPDPVWTYITLDSSKTGIDKIDTVLSAKTENEAVNELKQKKAEYEILAKTKDIECAKDYEIGDILRVQTAGITVYKLADGVKMWNERGYGEQPVLKEWEDENV